VQRIHNSTPGCCFFSNQLQVWPGPKGSRRLRLSDFKVVGLSALCTGHLYLPGYIPGIRLSRDQRHSVAGSIKSKKNFNDIIGHYACSAVPQPNAPLRAPVAMLWENGNNGREITEQLTVRLP
jgi:hypothetical protein